MQCPDCLKDGRKVTCVYDQKHQGIVCVRCERVYSPLLPSPDSRHYASAKACKRRMKRDQDERRLNPSTAALVDRILRGN